MDLQATARDYRRAVAAVATAQRAAAARVATARQRADDARVRLASAIVEAAQAGVRPVDIVKSTGYTKERVRQILRAGGVEPD